MGWGDEIMVTAEARRLQALDPRPVAVRGKGGQGARWHPIWDGNPRLTRPEAVHEGVQWLENYGGRRPYIEYARTTRERYAWRADYRVEPGEIYLTELEQREYRYLDDMVVIEPHVKAGAPNKSWGWERWQQLVHRLPRVRWLQLGVSGTRVLHGVRHIVTNDVRTASAVLRHAIAVVVPEGGLHHAAAALGIPGVVIFGGFISPATTGYDLHVNLFTGGEACGNRLGCAHCQQAMNSITVEQVSKALLGVLEKSKAA
jgi:hypothetical protein